MNNDTSLVCFKAISNFTAELGELFSKQQRSLKLYCRLINKTTIVHDHAIKKHIDAFKSFCIANREAIFTKSIDKLIISKISYSQRVYIDLNDIFKLSDKDTTKIIWEHLLCISALVDPAGKARDILKKNMEAGAGGEETNFLTDIINKVEQHVDPDANPMEAVSSIMKSGIFTELIGGMNNGLSNGSLDLSKLMGAVQGMVGKLSEQTSSPDESDNPMNMLTTMIGSLTGQPPGQPPHGNDITGLMQMMQNSGTTGGGDDLTGLMQVMMKNISQSNNDLVKVESDDLD